MNEKRKLIDVSIKRNQMLELSGKNFKAPSQRIFNEFSLKKTHQRKMSYNKKINGDDRAKNTIIKMKNSLNGSIVE